MRWLGLWRWTFGPVVALAAGLLPSGTAEANILCRILPMPCTYDGAAFRFTVVDAETRQPVTDVHALAEWQLHGTYGHDGPLMALDAVSGPDGQLEFPAWGPVRGPRSGLVLNSDPVVTLFKSGYKALRLVNPYPQGTTETTRVRRAGRDGQTIALEPFRGTPDEWVNELRKIWGAQASPMGDEDRLEFRGPYLNRLHRVWGEREKLPERFRSQGQFFWSVEELIKFLQEGRR